METSSCKTLSDKLVKSTSNWAESVEEGKLWGVWTPLCIFFNYISQSVLPALKMKIGKSKTDIKLEKFRKSRSRDIVGVGVEVAMEGVWGFKALPLLEAELWPQAMLSAKESSRGMEKRREVVLKKKGFLEVPQSSNQDAELDVAKCPRGGQERWETVTWDERHLSFSINHLVIHWRPRFLHLLTDSPTMDNRSNPHNLVTLVLLVVTDNDEADFRFISKVYLLNLCKCLLKNGPCCRWKYIILCFMN